MAIKKEILKVKQQDNNKYFIYSISSAESEFILCSFLNDLLKINLQIIESIQIILKSGPIQFKQYYFEQEEEFEKYYLLINKNKGQCLFPELKTTDYILLIVTEIPTANYASQMQKLKSHKLANAVFEVDPASLKSLNRILTTL